MISDDNIHTQTARHAHFLDGSDAAIGRDDKGHAPIGKGYQRLRMQSVSVTPLGDMGDRVQPKTPEGSHEDGCRCDAVAIKISIHGNVLTAGEGFRQPSHYRRHVREQERIMGDGLLGEEVADRLKCLVAATVEQMRQHNALAIEPIPNLRRNRLLYAPHRLPALKLGISRLPHHRTYHRSYATYPATCLPAGRVQRCYGTGQSWPW